MKKLALPAIITMALGATNAAVACSFGPGYEIAKPPSGFLVQRESFVPQPPRVSLLALERAYGVADGASCNDAGILTILLEGGTHPDIAGYAFRVVDGVFPDGVFPEAIVLPVDIGDGMQGFRFVWLDLAVGSDELAPIVAEIEVRQIARNGTEGEPASLFINDPGGSSLARPARSYGAR